MELKFDDFVGNKATVGLVNLYIDAALKDKSARIPDLAFLGPSGHGKTTLARIVAKHLERKLVEINATIVKDPFQFRSYIMAKDMPSRGAIIFIDECHALKKGIQINLLSATEEPRKLHTSQKDQVYTDTLPANFSFIFATTRRNNIIPELFNRLSAVEFMEYNTIEKAEMVIKYMRRQHEIDKHQMEPSCVLDIASRSRSARNLVRNCDVIIRLLNKNGGGSKITAEVVGEAFGALGIDKHGLNRLDRKLLKYLKKRNAPVGLETLGDLMNLPKKDIKQDVEPYLLRNNFMIRRSAGRMITKKGTSAV